MATGIVRAKHGVDLLASFNSNTTINCGEISKYRYIRFDGRYGTVTVCRSRIIPVELFGMYNIEVDLFSPDTNRSILCTCSFDSSNSLIVKTSGRTSLNARVYGMY